MIAITQRLDPTGIAASKHGSPMRHFEYLGAVPLQGKNGIRDALQHGIEIALRRLADGQHADFRRLGGADFSPDALGQKLMTEAHTQKGAPWAIAAARE